VWSIRHVHVLFPTSAAAIGCPAKHAAAVVTTGEYVQGSQYRLNSQTLALLTCPAKQPAGFTAAPAAVAKEPHVASVEEKTAPSTSSVKQHAATTHECPAGAGAAEQPTECLDTVLQEGMAVALASLPYPAIQKGQLFAVLSCPACCASVCALLRHLQLADCLLQVLGTVIHCWVVARLVPSLPPQVRTSMALRQQSARSSSELLTSCSCSCAWPGLHAGAKLHVGGELRHRKATQS
jgi:hypothetical protein